jgi:hypothetical protein
MRMITACLARALQSCTSRICVHVLLTFQEVMPISKTRNQLLPYEIYPPGRVRVYGCLVGIVRQTSFEGGEYACLR